MCYKCKPKVVSWQYGTRLQPIILTTDVLADGHAGMPRRGPSRILCLFSEPSTQGIPVALALLYTAV